MACKAESRRSKSFLAPKVLDSASRPKYEQYYLKVLPYGYEMLELLGCNPRGNLSRAGLIIRGRAT